MPAETETEDEERETSAGSEASTDSSTTEDSRETLPWAVHQPSARISGIPRAIIYMGDLDPTSAQNSDSYGVILEDVEVLNGDVFVNEARGEETGTTVDTIDEETSRPTDIRFLDGEDDDVAAYDRDGNLTTDENGPNTYVEADGVDADRILVFYNGMSGNRVGRTLDFNGQNFASYRQMGNNSHYLVKGLYQAHPDWRGASGSERGDLAKAGKAPRVVRAPILRYRVEESEGEDDTATLLDEDEFESPRIITDVTHYKDTRGYEMHLFDEDAFEEEFGDLTTPVDEMETGMYGIEAESELEYVSVRYSDADAILEQAGYSMLMYDDWEEPPEGWSPSYDDGSADTGFGLASEVVEDTEEQFAEQKQNFAVEAANALPDGKSPSEAFPGGIEGLVDKKGDVFMEEPDEDDVAEIRQRIYEQTEWLDSADLE